MFGRFFLLVLSLVSLSWIIFVGYDLLDRKEAIKPETIFGQQDGDIMIVNRTNEYALIQADFNINHKARVLLEKLVENPLIDEHIYCCEKKSKMLIRRNENWTAEAVGHYLQQKGIVFKMLDDRNFNLLNGAYTLRFKRNFLLIHASSDKVQPTQAIEWPAWDSKAGVSVIHLDNPLLSTNVYVKPHGQVVYQTQYGKTFDFQGLMDESLFARVVPAKTTSYQFVEKKYALQQKLINRSDILYSWIETGMVIFEYDGKKCLLADCINTDQEPADMLTAETGIEALNGRFKGVKICKNFPDQQEKGFYVSALSDMVLFAPSQEILDRIIADYELGNTLALDEKARASVFDGLPSRVSERHVNSGHKMTQTAYRNLIIRTEYPMLSEAPDVKGQSKSEQGVATASFSLKGDLAWISGNEQHSYILTEGVELLALNRRKISWRMLIQGKPMMAPRMIDLNGDGQKDLLFNTTEKLYAIAQNGSLLKGFPVDVASTGPVATYRWNNRNYLVLVQNGSNLSHIDAQGKILAKIPLGTGKFSSEVMVMRRAGKLTAFVNGDNGVQEVWLDQKRKGKSYPKGVSGFFCNRQQDKLYYYGISDGQLQRSTENGILEQVSAPSSLTEMRRLYRAEDPMLCFWNHREVCWLTPEGQLMKVPTLCSEIADADILFAQGKWYIAVLDALDNHIYLYDGNGKSLNHEALVGKNQVKLSWSANQLHLTTMLQHSVVQYYNLKR